MLKNLQNKFQTNLSECKHGKYTRVNDPKLQKTQKHTFLKAVAEKQKFKEPKYVKALNKAISKKLSQTDNTTKKFPTPESRKKQEIRRRDAKRRDVAQIRASQTRARYARNS